LNLALFVHAEHQGVVGRVQIQADDVPHLLDEERIGGKFETARTMRLQGKGLKQPVHGRFGNAAGLGRLPDTPVCPASWLARQRALQQAGDPLLPDGARPSRTQFVVEAGQAMLHETLAPFADGGFRPA
jgi:hypothetical protein